MDDYLKHVEVKFDEWRNDGEHCSLDDTVMYNLDRVMLIDFIRQALLDYQDKVREEIEKIIFEAVKEASAANGGASVYLDMVEEQAIGDIRYRSLLTPPVKE